MTPGMRSPSPIAYLLSQYPAVSHTFFFNEVIALRSLGLHIETASINPVSPPKDGFSSAELKECANTYYVKSGSKLAIMLRLVAITLRNPLAFLRGFREALSLAPWDIGSTMLAMAYLAEALLVGAWMREKQCGHLHVHFAGPVATVGLLASVAWDLPYSLTVHGPEDFYNIDEFYLKRKIEHARLVLCISDFCRSQLLRIVDPSLWSKFHVCRLGVDGEVFAPHPKDDTAYVQLVCVGRLHPSKGHIVLLQAIGWLAREDIAVRLDLIGDGPIRSDLEALIANEGLESIVTMHGACSHARTRELLMRANIFVLSSFAEGVPVALMEAMAMEIACVSTFVAGIPELIKDGSQGLLVAPSSVDQLTSALLELTTNEARRVTLARAGREKVLADYNLSQNTMRLAAVFRDYIAGTIN
jgi:colanic acid/amylovoran biosynthesis glycosyltransferase